MSRLLDQAYCEGAANAEEATGYFPHFSEWGQVGGEFDRRANTFQANVAGHTVLVAGCGYGWLVQKFVERGVTQAYGLDASPWCITGAGLYTTVAARIFQADATVAAQVAAVRSAALGGNLKFDLCITDDLLPALTDAEVPVALASLRAVVKANVKLIHIVSCTDFPAVRHPTWNWKTQAQWKALVGGDITWNPETGVQL